jgi:hypothetical protein
VSGGKLVTLGDAGHYISGSPGVDDRPEWQVAEALLLAVELDGRTIFARIGIMPALNACATPDAFQILPSARPPST